MFAGAIWPWIGFNLFVLVMLAIDLGVFHRKAHTISLKEASIWSVVWITLALALYFIFAHVIDKFYYLKLGLSVILTYVGVKMLVEGIFHVPTFLSLAVIALVLIAAIVASVLRARRQTEKPAVPEE